MWWLVAPAYLLIGYAFMCLFSYLDGKHLAKCPNAIGDGPDAKCYLHIEYSIATEASFALWPLVVVICISFFALLIVGWPIMKLMDFTSTRFKKMGYAKTQRH